MAVFPLDPDELTPALLTEVMADRHRGVVVRDIEIRSAKRCGEGIASTADRLVLGLEYGPGTADDLPEQLILKTMLATPHAPAVMYETEVRFYTELREELAIETPRCHGSRFDPTSGRFGLLLEDLGRRDARFPDATISLEPAEIESLLSQLARLHAAFWNSPRFETDLSWVATPMGGGMHGVFDGIGRELISDQIARHPAKQEIVARTGRSFDDLWADLWGRQERMCGPPATLLHGDAHVGNTYLLPGGGGLLDWQLMVRGSWAHDVMYLLTTSLSVEQRRRRQEELVRGYLAELSGRGVSDVPSEADAWSLLGTASLWGLVIGWLITPPDNYGPEITQANLERVVTTVLDLGLD